MPGAVLALCVLPNPVLTKSFGVLLLCCYYDDYYHPLTDGDGGIGGIRRLGSVAQDHTARTLLSNTVTSSHMLLVKCKFKLN